MDEDAFEILDPHMQRTIMNRAKTKRRLTEAQQRDIMGLVYLAGSSSVPERMSAQARERLFDYVESVADARVEQFVAFAAEHMEVT